MQTTQTVSQTGTKARTFAVINIVAGGLLFVAPWVLGYSGETAALVTSLVIGAVTVLAALAATVQRSWSWVTVVAGSYAVIAALVIGGSAAAIATGVVLGLAIGALGLITAVIPE